MADSEKDLGRLVSVHGIAPAYLQRAVFIVVLSFMFFLVMMFAFYTLQSVVYFLLASAFLVLYLLTMFSWMTQRKSIVKVHQLGVNYKNRSALWSEIESVEDGTISLSNAKPIAIPKTIHDGHRLIETIRQKIREV